MSRRSKPATVRLIAHDGSEIGIMSGDQAQRMAEEQGLELVPVDDLSQPPVYRMMDFQKFKYLNQRRQKATRRWRTRAATKEFTVTPRIDSHDLTQKVAQLRRLLDQGHTCRLTILFEGPEAIHRDRAIGLLDWVVRALAKVGTVAATERWEGQMAVVVLSPRFRIVGPGPEKRTGAGA